ncbi:metallophosphoesterase [Motiliproteus sediminis]|uniref:metallophosphoesterase n=1 Tax=Motiliproteus sediminis TaxID=1468178 RepID=UPI001AEFE21F|nr:metallophosphoesterase [Motiliproteus sediminis]
MSTPELRVVQISDLHLPPMPQQRYRNLDVSARLDKVLATIAERFPQADRLLVTGDNVHNGSERDYAALAARLDRFGVPWYWIPGNHDSVELMQLVRPVGPPWPAGCGWQCVLLDSTGQPDGRGAGSLTEAAQATLRRAAEDPRPALVVLHHNPMRVDSRWQDAIGLQNADGFWQSAARLHPRSVVVCGHLHQVWDYRDLPLRVLSCPSTAVQFRRSCASLELECDGNEALPGYRWLRLGAAGELATGIERVPLA